MDLLLYRSLYKQKQLQILPSLLWDDTTTNLTMYSLNKILPLRLWRKSCPPFCFIYYVYDNLQVDSLTHSRTFEGTSTKVKEPLYPSYQSSTLPPTEYTSLFFSYYRTFDVNRRSSCRKVWRSECHCLFTPFPELLRKPRRLTSLFLV